MTVRAADGTDNKLQLNVVVKSAHYVTYLYTGRSKEKHDFCCLLEHDEVKIVFYYVYVYDVVIPFWATSSFLFE